MELNLQQVQEFINTNKDNAEVKSYLQGLNKIALDGVKSFLESDEEGKKYLNSYSDNKVTNAIKTFEQNTLPKRVEEEIKKRNPSLDPKDLEIQKLKEQFENMQKETMRKDLQLKVSKIAAEKQISSDLIPFILDEDEEKTMDNLKALEKALGDYSKIIRSQILAEGSYTPKKNFSNNTTVNPYKKETWSMTAQMELEKNNPTLAAQLKSQLNM